ncbi:hypothetical protein FHS27_003322 [Rhodopirellula rubra]|uniref:Uncharacterized protein n=1 Tax=Aporhodopirellula rubra TaxID=980271 RepID=A0A7W5E1D1_9BACT|nr:hypothetical protein [Aporhodopirellula rubra]MBB3207497.1 hypothetical protein [Aporhodopirellula rubra]
MLCDFCNRREAVVHRFRVLNGFASLCEPCLRYSIEPQKHLSSEGDFCLVTSNNLNIYQQKTTGTGDDDARSTKETNL